MLSREGGEATRARRVARVRAPRRRLDRGRSPERCFPSFPSSASLPWIRCSTVRPGCRRRGLLLEPGVTPLFELQSELLAAREGDAAVDQYLEKVGDDVVQEPLVVRHD